MAYVNKRSGKNGAKRFTGLYKAVDGTYKSAGTFDTEERALEVAQALSGMRTADIEANTKEPTPGT
jgi:hypothetical protein